MESEDAAKKRISSRGLDQHTFEKKEELKEKYEIALTRLIDNAKETLEKESRKTDEPGDYLPPLAFETLLNVTELGTRFFPATDSETLTIAQQELKHLCNVLASSEQGKREIWLWENADITPALQYKFIEEYKKKLLRYELSFFVTEEVFQACESLLREQPNLLKKVQFRHFGINLLNFMLKLVPDLKNNSLNIQKLSRVAFFSLNFLTDRFFQLEKNTDQSIFNRNLFCLFFSILELSVITPWIKEVSKEAKEKKEEYENLPVWTENLEKESKKIVFFDKEDTEKLSETVGGLEKIFNIRVAAANGIFFKIENFFGKMAWNFDVNNPEFKELMLSLDAIRTMAQGALADFCSINFKIRKKDKLWKDGLAAEIENFYIASNDILKFLEKLESDIKNSKQEDKEIFFQKKNEMQKMNELMSLSDKKFIEEKTKEFPQEFIQVELNFSKAEDFFLKQPFEEGDKEEVKKLLFKAESSIKKIKEHFSEKKEILLAIEKIKKFEREEGFLRKISSVLHIIDYNKQTLTDKVDRDAFLKAFRFFLEGFDQKEISEDFNSKINKLICKANIFISQKEPDKKEEEKRVKKVEKEVKKIKESFYKISKKKSAMLIPVLKNCHLKCDENFILNKDIFHIRPGSEEVYINLSLKDSFMNFSSELFPENKGNLSEEEQKSQIRNILNWVSSYDFLVEDETRNLLLEIFKKNPNMEATKLKIYHALCILKKIEKENKKINFQGVFDYKNRWLLHDPDFLRDLEWVYTIYYDKNVSANARIEACISFQEKNSKKNEIWISATQYLRHLFNETQLTDQRKKLVNNVLESFRDFKIDDRIFSKVDLLLKEENESKDGEKKSIFQFFEKYQKTYAMFVSISSSINVDVFSENNIYIKLFEYFSSFGWVFKKSQEKNKFIQSLSCSLIYLHYHLFSQIKSHLFPLEDFEEIFVGCIRKRMSNQDYQKRKQRYSSTALNRTEYTSFSVGDMEKLEGSPDFVVQGKPYASPLPLSGDSIGKSNFVREVFIQNLIPEFNYFANLGGRAIDDTLVEFIIQSTFQTTQEVLAKKKMGLKSFFTELGKTDKREKTSREISPPIVPNAVKSDSALQVKKMDPFSHSPQDSLLIASVHKTERTRTNSGEKQIPRSGSNSDMELPSIHPNASLSQSIGARLPDSQKLGRSTASSPLVKKLGCDPTQTPTKGHRSVSDISEAGESPDQTYVDYNKFFTK